MPNDSLFAGHYFIYGKTAGLDKSSWYLHPDGIWRTSTKNEKGEWSGYYATYEDALAAADRFLQHPSHRLAAD